MNIIIPLAIPPFVFLYTCVFILLPSFLLLNFYILFSYVLFLSLYHALFSFP
jgi:hypothetical protein